MTGPIQPVQPHHEWALPSTVPPVAAYGNHFLFITLLKSLEPMETFLEHFVNPLVMFSVRLPAYRHTIYPVIIGTPQLFSKLTIYTRTDQCRPPTVIIIIPLHMKPALCCNMSDQIICQIK